MLEKTVLIQEIVDLLMIVNRITRSLSYRSDDCLLDAVSPMQMHILITISKLQILKMSELAEAMVMTRQQLTKAIDTLVEKGYVQRSADPGNRRHVMIELTELGGRLLRETFLKQETMLNRILEDTSDEDARRFLEALRTIKEVFSKHTSISRAKTIAVS